MKKTFTMLFAVAITFAASAQTGYKNQNNVAAYTQHAGTDFSFRQKQKELNEINRKFDHEVLLVKTDRFARRKEKAMRLARLEDQRNAEVRKVERFYEMHTHDTGDAYSHNRMHH